MIKFKEWIENQNYNAQTDPVFNCLDCERNTHVLGEYPFKLPDEMWHGIVPGGKGMLCVDCANKRFYRKMGRLLEPQDFEVLPKNQRVGLTSIWNPLRLSKISD